MFRLAKIIIFIKSQLLIICTKLINFNLWKEGNKGWCWLRATLLSITWAARHGRPPFDTDTLFSLSLSSNWLGQSLQHLQTPFLSSPSFHCLYAILILILGLCQSPQVALQAGNVNESQCTLVIHPFDPSNYNSKSNSNSNSNYFYMLLPYIQPLFFWSCCSLSLSSNPITHSPHLGLLFHYLEFGFHLLLSKQYIHWLVNINTTEGYFFCS